MNLNNILASKLLRNLAEIIRFADAGASPENPRWRVRVDFHAWNEATVTMTLCRSDVRDASQLPGFIRKYGCKYVYELKGEKDE